MPNYRKYLNHASRKRHEKRTLVEIYKRHPIIKSDKETALKGTDRYITYQIPVQSRHFTYSITWNKAHTICYQSCGSIEQARKYIDYLPEIIRKSRLRRKIGKHIQTIIDMVKKQIKGHGNYKHLEFGLIQMAEYPRENEYCHNYDANQKFIGKTIHKYGKTFNLSMSEQKNIIKALFDTEEMTSEELREAYENLSLFVEDITDNRETIDWAFKDYIDPFLKDIPLYSKFLVEAEEHIIEIEDLREKHGIDSRENVTIPQGYKLMDVGYYCWPGYSCDEDTLAIQTDDETIEILIFLGNGMGGYSGEVQYKIDKETSRYYSIGRRGIDSAFNGSENYPETIKELIVRQGNEARKRQERIKRSVDVHLGSRSWKVTPENIEEIKKLLRDGKSRTFLPSGMGIGVIIASSRENLPYNLSKYNAGESAEKLFGMPVYAQDFEYD